LAPGNHQYGDLAAAERFLAGGAICRVDFSRSEGSDAIIAGDFTFLIALGVKPLQQI
jgi:hypothetical protein